MARCVDGTPGRRARGGNRHEGRDKLIAIFLLQFPPNPSDHQSDTTNVPIIRYLNTKSTIPILFGIANSISTYNTRPVAGNHTP